MADGTQWLLATTAWDSDKVRDALFGYVKKHLETARQALEFSQTVFGGNLNCTTYGDSGMPPDTPDVD